MKVRKIRLTKSKLEYIYYKAQKSDIKLPITVLVALITTLICTLFSLQIDVDEEKRKLPLLLLKSAYTGWTFSYAAFILCACWEYLLKMDNFINISHKNKFPNNGATGSIICSLFLMFADIYFILFLYKAEVDNILSAQEIIACIGIPIIVVANSINMKIIEKKIDNVRCYVKTDKFL